MDSDLPEINTRCGYIAVIGPPNAGKSTLINALVGTKVSIVSPKVQTTRTKVLGIALYEDAQIILVDTPGIFKPNKRNNLERAIVSAAWDGLSDADHILLVLDVTHYKKQDFQMILNHMKEVKTPASLALNKIDKIKAETLLAISQELNALYPFENTFMISALKERGIEDIFKTLTPTLPQGPFLYPEDEISDMPMRLLAAEITREKLFHKLHQEIPYNLTVETEDWEEFTDGSIKIGQTIYLAKDNHKGMILGKGGQQIKSVGEKSRIELEEILDTRVHLKLFVKVRENWMNDHERYTPWGLDKDA